MVAVILVNWNAWQDTVECLNSLIPILEQGDHIYVVDNASSDGSVDQIQAWLTVPCLRNDWRQIEGVPSYATGETISPIPFCVLDEHGNVLKQYSEARVSIVAGANNLGFAGGNNIGLRFALKRPFEAFWLLNTDTVVDRSALAELLLRLGRDSSCGMVGSTLLYYRLPHVVQALAGRLNLHNTSVGHIGEGLDVTEVPKDGTRIEQQMAYVVGASILASRKFVETVGLMQDDYFLYFEEIDWALRGKGAFSLGYAPKSRVYHKVGASSAKVVSEFSLNLLYRNRIRFANRFMPNALDSTLRSLWAELFRHILKGRWVSARVLWRVLRQRKSLIASAPSWQGLES